MVTNVSCYITPSSSLSLSLFLFSDNYISTTLLISNIIISLLATTYIRIHKAAQLGDLKTIEAACEDDADLNQTDRFSKTPLMVAAANGRAEIVAVLLKHG